MKKCLFLIATTFIFGCTLFGQNPVIVDTLGHVTIGQSASLFPHNPLKVQKFQSQFEGALINATVASNGEAVNDVAIRGSSVPVDGKGIGGEFIGGFRGVRGEVVANGGAQYEGVSGLVTGGGSGAKYGVLGASLGATGGSGVAGQAGGSGSFNYGVSGWAFGQNTNYGVYGTATGGTENWAGYFNGNAHFTNRLTVGTTDHDAPVVIKMNQDSVQSAMVHAEIIGDEASDKIAIRGVSKPVDYYGIGGRFEGGFMGAEGIVQATGSWTYTGISGVASGGMESSNKYGIQGNASGPGTNCGVYGSATFGSTNWGGYFIGQGYFSDRLAVGTTNPQDLIHAKGVNPGLRLESNTGATGRFLLNSGNELNISNDSPAPIRFLINNTEKMRLSSDGRLGIGTTDLLTSNVHISGLDNNGTNSTLRLTSGGQHMLLDGNEIDAFGFGMYINNNSTEDLVMVNGGGQVGINETAPQAMLDIKELGNNERAIRIENDGNGNSWSFTMNNDDLTFYFGNTQKARIESVNGAWTPLSDRRVKKNIHYLSDNFLDRINALKPANYHYVDNAEDERKSIGFIAQEVQQIFPEYIDRNGDELMSLDYNIFSVLAIKSIQELSIKNELLEETNVQLEGRITNLEDRLIELEKLISNK